MTTPNFKKFNIEAYKPGKSKVKKFKDFVICIETALGMSPKAKKIRLNKNQIQINIQMENLKI